MDETFFDICGYTDSEVDLYFKEHIDNWATLRKVPYKAVRDGLKLGIMATVLKRTPRQSTVHSPLPAPLTSNNFKIFGLSQPLLKY